jgi:hypothetical protein
MLPMQGNALSQALCWSPHSWIDLVGRVLPSSIALTSASSHLSTRTATASPGQACVAEYLLNCSFWCRNCAKNVGSCSPVLHSPYPLHQIIATHSSHAEQRVQRIDVCAPPFLVCHQLSCCLPPCLPGCLQILSLSGCGGVLRPRSLEWVSSDPEAACKPWVQLTHTLTLRRPVGQGLSHTVGLRNITTKNSRVNRKRTHDSRESDLRYPHLQACSV